MVWRRKTVDTSKSGMQRTDDTKVNRQYAESSSEDKADVHDAIEVESAHMAVRVGLTTTWQ